MKLLRWLGLALPPIPPTVWLPVPDNNPACMPDGTELHITAYGVRVDNGPGQSICELNEVEWLYRPNRGDDLR